MSKTRVAKKVLIVLFVVLGFLLPSIVPLVPMARGYSTEITFGTPGLSQNNGTYARFNVGDAYYYAFIVGNHIGVYDEDAATVRDIDLSTYCSEWVGSGGNSFIYPYNLTHALVVTDTYYAIYYSLLIKISTGTITVVGTWGSGTAQRALSLSPIFKYGTNYYVVYELWTYSGDAVTQGIERIFPTVGAYSFTPSSSYQIRTPMFVIPSQDDNTVFYLLGRQSSTTHDLAMATKRFRLVSLNFTDATLKGLGEGSFNYDWSNYTILLNGPYYHNITNTNYIYDMLVAYPDLYSASCINVGLIRFNNTYLSDAAPNQFVREIIGSAGKTYLRPFDMAGGSGRYDMILDDSDTLIIYSGYSDRMYAFLVHTNDIETDTPYLSLPGYNDQYYGDDKIHPYYDSSNSIGGFHPPEQYVGIYIDYVNHKFKADTFPHHYYEYGVYQFSSTWKIDATGQDVSTSPVYIGTKYRLSILWKYRGVPDVEGYMSLYWKNVLIKSVFIHSSVSIATLTYSASAKPYGTFKIVLTDVSRGMYNETYTWNQIVVDATTTTSTGGPGTPPDLRDFLPNFSMVIGMIIVFFPGLFLGSKYGLFAGIMGAMFGLSLTYVFPSIGLPVSVQILVGVGMVFALFFGSQKWGSGKKSD